MPRFFRIALAVFLISAAGMSALIVMAHGNDEAEPGEVTYAEIAPILAENCMRCHVEGGIGSVSFEDPDMVQFGAETIAEAVASRTMPPWMPGPNTPPLIDERKLTEEEIALIVQWVEDGAHLGDLESVQEIALAEFPEVRADLTLEMPVEYTPDATLLDDYRCFLIDPGQDSDHYITGYTVQPGQPTIVHHVLLYQVGRDSMDAALARDAEDERPGWQCFGGPGVPIGNIGGGAMGLAASVGSWTPGSLPTFYPEGTGQQLSANSLIVMQVHYNLENAAVPDQTRAVFQFADDNSQIDPLSLMPLVAPVEIPCAAGNTSPDCDRDAALAHAINVDGRRAVSRTTGLLGLCDSSPLDYIDQDAANVVSSCDYRIRRDTWVIGSVAHMHQRGSAFLIERNPDSETAEILLDIPAWDFHWQGGYQYVEPILLHSGDTVRITCTWDNSDGSRYILWGEGTSDEMCLGGLMLRPVE